MLKKLILTGITFLTILNIFAQGKNTVYMEALGVGFLYSLNYERNINDNITVRVGYSYIPLDQEFNIDSRTIDEKATITSIPIMANYLIGGGNHKLAVSGGVSIISSDAETSFGDFDLFSTTAKVFGGGYRYQSLTGGGFFNASTYLFNLGDVGRSQTYGFGFGWTF